VCGVVWRVCVCACVCVIARYPENEVQSIMRQILKGVAFIHSRNIAHFDLKPENFLLTLDKPMTLKIADFGVAMDLKVTLE